MGAGNEARSNEPSGIVLTASSTLVICEFGNNRLRRVDPKNGHVSTIDRPFAQHDDISFCSDGTPYVLTRDGIFQISNGDVAMYLVLLQILGLVMRASRVATSMKAEGPCLRHYFLWENIHSRGRGTRSGRAPPCTYLPTRAGWALTQRERAEIAPATGIIGVDEAKIRSLLLRLMRVRVAGVLGLVVLRLAFG